jgi:Rrf2 family nitric oxide-sensitive transcriptional repressor
MLSQTAEYALRAIVWLADHPDRPQTANTIAAAMQVPRMYLSKVMRQLVEHGVVTAQRGKSGGFTLARSVKQISVLDVVNAVDPVQRIHSCPLHLDRHKDKLCPLHRKLDAAAAALEKDFRCTSMLQLIGGEYAG